jgi:predicted outer membrane repeat protein
MPSSHLHHRSAARPAVRPAGRAIGAARAALCLAAMTAVVALAPVPAPAATWTVLTDLDTGFGSLRFWVDVASDGDEIRIGPSLAGATITLENEIFLDKDLTITGVDAPGVIIDAGGQSRVFSVASGTTVTLAHLRLTGGRAGGGGAIANRGNLTISHCSIQGNQTTDSNAGGGVYNLAASQPARLVIEDSVITGNQADGPGGGLFNYAYAANVAEMVVRRSSVTFNGASDGAGVATLARAGGIARTVIEDSEVSWNVSDGWGGGLRAEALDHSQALAVLELRTTTVTGNVAGGRGGGVATTMAGARITLTGCAVTANTAADGYPDVTWLGVGSTLAFLGGNVVGSTDGLLAISAMPSDQFGAVARDLPRPPGRPAPTLADVSPHAPSADEHLRAPAPPAGVPTTAATGPGGAIAPGEEVVPTAGRVTLLVTDPGDSGPGTLRETVASAAAGDLIRFDPSLAGETITLASQIVIDRDLSLDGSDAPGLALDGGSTTRLLLIDQGVHATVTDLTLRHGHGTWGGAIRNRGTLILRDCHLHDNHAGERGGAITTTGADLGVPGRLVVERCEFTGNSSNGDGGAIAVLGISRRIAHLEVRESTFSGNSGGRGGAIYCTTWDDGACTARILDSEITGNTGFYAGGGLRAHRDVGGQLIWASVVRTELRENHTGNTGGGAATLTSSTWLDFRDTTILGNTTDGDGPELAQASDAPPLIFLGGNTVGTTDGVQAYAAAASDIFDATTSSAPGDDPSVPTPSLAPRVSVYPNPFNPRTQVEFALAASGPATLEILDVRGRVVARPWQGTVRAGEPTRVRWTGHDHAGRPAASGVYVFRVLGPDGTTATGRATLVR